MHLMMLLLLRTSCFAFASLNDPLITSLISGATRSTLMSGTSRNTEKTSTFNSTGLSATLDSSQGNDHTDISAGKRPLRILFLSSDTGGGHRASAEALAKQFQIQFPGSTYDLLDVWTLDGVYPYKTLVKSYKHLSAHPFQWRFFYHISNAFPNGRIANIHSGIMCAKKIRKRIAGYDPDVVVSVHPAMNNAPRIATRKLGEMHGKHIPFFTVVTDLGSGHSHWFEKKVEKLYVASERIRKLARRRAGTPSNNIVMSGLPIRQEFAVQSEKLGDRTTEIGKLYQKEIREKLGISTNKQMVLLMGGGEGVGSLAHIANELYMKLVENGVDATVCVVCGRNEKLRNELRDRDWENLTASKPKGNSRRLSFSRKVSPTVKDPPLKGDVEVVGLGYIDEMADYMVAADVLVTKAGPGTLAEAAAVGLPVMMTSFLPGQEAGNVEVVLDAGFGEYCKQPEKIGQTVANWLKNEELLCSMSKSATKAGHPHAAAEIAVDIGEITQKWLETNLKANGGARKSIAADC
eukprot:CAMPEP_0178914470 /NCGR_PEP_ID=MMETSP0786-20121207/11444_1 /TAXON_ID=186022 /ORGANISM="Thalassionema frauenfeldii, Strain CCMP 1798" /LENGTH=519 /DNA_ID=CAMNT_0020587383 /DNA_START=107 /DNA_END=1666 /DNA_ORIENTATION=+